MTCSDPNVTPANNIDVVFNLDSSLVNDITVKEYDQATGNWTEVTPQTDNSGKVIVKTRKFTSFGVFLPVTVTTTSSTEEIMFAQDLFDNRKGLSNMIVDNATFTYKAGTSITSKASNKLQGLLIEQLARLFGAQVTEMNGTYPLNLTLGVGQGVLLKGTQTVNAVSVSARNTTVTGTNYGNVTVTVSSFSVDHNGGVVGDN